MTNNKVRNPDCFGAAEHDHDRCIAAAMATAIRVCKRRGVRLTALRQRVLELVWSSHKPLGAYAILEVLHADGRSAAPPTVYRALEFLQGQGLVHRIASLNAFVGCSDPLDLHAGQFLICRNCGCAAELNDRNIETTICNSAHHLGFFVQHQIIEVIGLCPHCYSATSNHAGA